LKFEIAGADFGLWTSDFKLLIMQNLSLEAIRDNKKLTFPVKESNKSRILGKLRYWWCWLAAALLLLVVGAPTVVAFWILNRKKWLYPFALWGARTWLQACGARVKVRGTENLQAGENYVFISNHRSYLDTAALFAHTTRRIGLVAKKELLKAPVMGQGMGFVNIIAIDRSNAERALQSMNKARAVMDDGYSFGVFAEGTRALPGELLPFKKGAFHLALQTGAPIIPVAIKNTDWMMGKKTGVAYGGTIEMVLLPPIETKNFSGDDLMELLKRTRTAVAEELSR
jgi:1-acyl-sn-glycerol-3-phosphate acyltransferase